MLIFLSRMDTALLETFREVARHRSISAAARQLDYTQSAVSRQIAALEATFGVRLFDRRAGGVELTEHGRTLLAHADALVERLHLARRDLEALDRLERGRLRIGAFDTANASLIPRAMATFAADVPNVSLSLIEGTTRRLLTRLETDEVDLAVISAFPGQRLDRNRYELVPLVDDAMLVALPGSHRLAGRSRRIRLAELDGDPWIGADSTDDDRVLGPARLTAAPRSDFPVREWPAKLGLVAAGLGITLVPALAAAAAPPGVALVVLHPEDAAPRMVYAATRHGRTSLPATERFITALKQAATQITA